MNRKEEYQLLLSQLEQETPASLDDCVKKARHRARARRGWRASLTSLGGIAAAFVLAVNVSVPFAMACSRVPGLRELTAAVAFSPSLKAAVQNDFVQYIGQSQTADGITLKLEHLIFDATQLHFFFTVDGEGYDSFHVYPTISGPDGEELEGYSITSAMSLPGELCDFGVNFTAGFQPPQALRLTCQVTGQKEQQGMAVAPADSSVHAPRPGREPEVIAQFTFDLALDPRFTAPGQTIPMEKWVTVEGQRLLLRSLEIYPTHARLTVVSDEDNTAWCKGLDFCLTDAKGDRYEPGSRASSGSSLISHGTGEENEVVYYLESPHFTGKAPYTLHITGAKWLDKDRAWTTIDLNDQTGQGLPDGVEVLSAQWRGKDVELTFSGVSQEGGSLFSWDYRDPEGNERTLSSGGYATHTGEDGAGHQEWYFTLSDYPWDTVSLKLSYTRSGTLAEPISVEIVP